jgi:hypothetical protein
VIVEDGVGSARQHVNDRVPDSYNVQRRNHDCRP